MSCDQTASGADSRPVAPELEAILGRPLPVLDDGYVRVVDYMGSDAAIVQAARVSYGAGTRRVSEDRTLIRYLLRHRHTTPFEMCEIKLHVRVPMDCWRQWIRHRTANVNEYSTRYSVAIDAASRTAPDQWRLQTAANRQGSEGRIDAAAGARLSAAEADLQRQARAVYQERLDAGVAREQARKDLPLSTYTEAYWKIDLHNLLHFLGLRADSHAQEEIRAYATLIGEQVVRRWVPLTWEAYPRLPRRRPAADPRRARDRRPPDRRPPAGGAAHRRAGGLAAPPRRPASGRVGNRAPAPQPRAHRGRGQARRVGADRALAHRRKLTGAPGRPRRNPGGVAPSRIVPAPSLTWRRTPDGLRRSSLARGRYARSPRLASPRLASPRPAPPRRGPPRPSRCAAGSPPPVASRAIEPRQAVRAA